MKFYPKGIPLEHFFLAITPGEFHEKGTARIMRKQNVDTNSVRRNLRNKFLTKRSHTSSPGWYGKYTIFLVIFHKIQKGK